MPTRCPNQVSVLLMNSSSAINAIRLAAMLAAKPIAFEAPDAAASTIFTSVLKKGPVIIRNVLQQGITQCLELENLRANFRLAINSILWPFQSSLSGSFFSNNHSVRNLTPSCWWSSVSSDNLFTFHWSSKLNRSAIADSYKSNETITFMGEGGWFRNQTLIFMSWTATEVVQDIR